VASKRKDKQDQEAFNFEKALGELEKVVAVLESGELGLEEALSRFESGVKLTRQCQLALDQARQRVETLAEQGDLTLEQECEDES